MRSFRIHNLYLGINLFIFRLTKFAVNILGARLLSSAAFGMFAYIYSFCDIFVHIFGLGVDIAASRRWSESAEPAQDIGLKVRWQQAAIIKGFLSLFGAACGFIFLPWPYSAAFGLWHVCFMQSKLAYGFVNTMLYPRGVLVAGLVSQTALLAAVYVGITYWGLLGFILAFAAERMLEAVCLWLAIFIKLPLLREGWLIALRAVFDNNGCKVSGYLFSRPTFVIWLAQLIGVLVARADALLVKSFLDYHALSIYFLACRTAEAPLFLFAAIADSSLAYFIRHEREREVNYKESVTKALWLGGALSLVLCLFGLSGIAEWVFGRQYDGVGIILAAYSWVLLLRGANMVSSSLLLATGRESDLLKTTFYGLAVNIIGNILLLPILGLWGGVLCAVSAEACIYLTRARLMVIKPL